MEFNLSFYLSLSRGCLFWFTEAYQLSLLFYTVALPFFPFFPTSGLVVVDIPSPSLERTSTSILFFTPSLLFGDFSDLLHTSLHDVLHTFSGMAKSLSFLRPPISRLQVCTPRSFLNNRHPFLKQIRLIRVTEFPTLFTLA